MADKTPVRVVFNESNVATGMAEFQSGETVPVANGGTGLSSIGSAGQVLRTNAAGNALEFATLEDLADIISVGSTLTAPSNADFNITTAGTGNIVLNDLSISDNTLSTNRSNDDLHINASGTGTVVLENLKIGSSGSTVTTILDEDNMSSDSATSLATQQSIKAYVDSEVSAVSTTSISTGDSNVTVVDSGTGNVTIQVDGTDRITTVAATTTTATGHSLVIGAGSNSAGGQIKFLEGTDNGTNGVTLLGPASTADVTVTLPAATDTLVGKATTDTFTNKTIDANGTGNSITNLEVADLASGVLDTDLSSVSGSDDTLASAKAIKTYADTKAVLSGSTNNQITTVTGAHAIQGESNLTFDGSTLAVTGAVTVSGDLAVDTNTLFVDVSTNRVGVGSTTLSQPFTIHNTSSAQIHLRTANPAIRFSSDEAGGSDSTRAFIGLATNSNAFINGTAAGDLAVRSATDGKILLGHSGGEYARLTTSGATFTAGVTATTGTFSGNVSISGDLTVSGDTTTVSTTNTAISDNILELNTGISQSFNDAGIIIERGSTGNNAAIIWDESADTFVLGTTTATAGDKSGGITIDAGSLKIASLEVDGVTITDNTIGANASNSSLELEASGTGDIDLNAGADVNIPANIGLTFGDDGEKIEGDGTNLYIVSSNALGFDVANGITLDSGSGGTILKAGGSTTYGTLTSSSGDLSINQTTSDKDIIFTGNDGGSTITALSFDMSAAGAATFNDKIVLGANKAIEFGDAGESISGDGTDMTITGNIIKIDAASRIILDAQENRIDLADNGSEFGRFVNNGGQLRILTGSGAATAVSFDSSGGATFGQNVAVTGDLTVSGNTTTVSTTNTTIADNIIELNTGISQSLNDAGIIIERGSTGNNAAIIWDESADTFVLGTTTATAADKSSGITIDAGSLKVASLEADGVTITDNTVSANASNSALQLASSGTGDIDLNAGADVNIPANIGLTFGDDGEKIEGDGTDLTIASSNKIILSADGAGQVFFKDGGTELAKFFVSSQVFTLETIISDGDFAIKGNDGGSSVTALSLDMSEAGAATFNDKIVLGTNKEIQFVDTNESIKSDGSKMIIKSGGTTFNLPTADGTAGQALVTDGSGTLSFDSVATTVSDDGLATVKSNKHLGSTARTLDSINATFIDSAFYFFVLNDIVNETISAEMFAVTNNDTASFLGNRRGIESSGGDNVPTLATDISNGQYRVRVTGTSADCRGSFYKVAMSSSTTDATRGNTVTSSNTDVDSASESVDTFAHATFRGAKYFISVDNDSKTEMEVVEALVVHDGTNAFISQYGHTTSGNNSLVTLTAAISGDNVVVSAAGLETNLNLTMHKILIKDNMTAQSNANQKAFAAVTVSSSATPIDLMDIDEANGAVYFIVGANSSEGAYSIQEVYTAATPGVPAVANGPFVSTKGTRQLEFTAGFDTSSENSLELFASSTSGGSTTVSGYRISVLAG